MPIAVETLGRGSPVVLLHGWGMNRQVWRPIAERLALFNKVFLVDLPGHGEAGYQAGDWELPLLIDQLLDAVPEPATWIGWSLGGLVAQQLAVLVQENVRKLVLVNSTPRFVQGEHWDCAMPKQDFARFHDAFMSDPEGTRKKFIGLCTLGEPDASQTRKTLKNLLGEINVPALHDALERLADTDLTDQLDWINASTLYVLGERDQVVPSDVMLPLMEYFPMAQSEVLRGAAHVPMLSHTQQLFLLMHRFISEPGRS